MIHGMTFKEYVDEEKAKMSEMTKEEKINYFKDYYLKLCIVAVIVLLLCIWLFIDVGLNFRHTIVTGGVVNTDFTDEGSEFLSDKYMDYTGKSRAFNRIDFSSEIFLDKNDAQMVAIFRAELGSNIYNYLITDEETLDFIVDTECLADLDEALDDDLKNRVKDKLVYKDLKESKINIAAAVDLTDTAFAKKYVKSGKSIYFVLTGKEKDYNAGLDMLKYILEMN